MFSLKNLFKGFRKFFSETVQETIAEGAIEWLRATFKGGGEEAGREVRRVVKDKMERERFRDILVQFLQVDMRDRTVADRLFRWHRTGMRGEPGEEDRRTDFLIRVFIHCTQKDVDGRVDKPATNRRRQKVFAELGACTPSRLHQLMVLSEKDWGWQWYQRFAAWVARNRWFSRFVCFITLTHREQVPIRNLAAGVTPAFREETDEEMTDRALWRLKWFVLVVLILATIAALVAVPFLFYRLSFGSAAAEAGIGGVLAGVLWTMFCLAALSLIAIIVLKVWGFKFAWRRYWATLFFLTTVGLGVRLFAHFFSLGEHRLLAGAALLSIAILAWNGVYRRVMQWSEGEKKPLPGRLQRALSGTATVVLVGTTGLMAFQAARPALAELPDMIQKVRIYQDEFSAEHLFSRDGNARYCRPATASQEKEDLGWWYEHVYACDGINPGTVPTTGTNGRPLTPDEAGWYLAWRAEEDAGEITATDKPGGAGEVIEVRTKSFSRPVSMPSSHSYTWWVEEDGVPIEFRINGTKIVRQRAKNDPSFQWHHERSLVRTLEWRVPDGAPREVAHVRLVLTPWDS